MPTGYTECVQSGKVTEFEDFAIQCARAMGACIMQRDDPMSDAPKLEEPSDHYEERIAELEKERAELKAMTWEQIVNGFHEYKLATTKRCHEGIDEKHRQEKRYRAMLAKVQAWMPPTDDHVKFKEFMMEQLTSSIDFDCGTDYYMDQLHELKSQTPEDWHKGRLESCERSLAYYKGAHKDEIERIANRNQWKIDLFESLGKELV